MSRRNWTTEELILAFNLYCKTPFTKINRSNKDVIELSNYLDRSVSAIALKLANYARLDPFLQSKGISGMKNGSKAELEIWNEFHDNWEKLSFESEKLLAEKKGIIIENFIEKNSSNVFRTGKDKIVEVKQRVNQSFFRKIILASYDNRCCVTGMNIPELLNASHIIPWSKDEENRMNPQNGVCLNAFHDRAFDRGLLTITTDFTIVFSEKLLKNKTMDFFSQFIDPYQNKKITLPQRFLPKKEFLEYHSSQIFQK